MMKLIADSGSSKCDWVVIDDSVRIDVNTMGLNPFFHDAEFIQNIIQNEPGLVKYVDEIAEVHYYGAGCSSDDLKEVVSTGLSAVFSNALVSVQHDALSSVFATYDGDSCISCIIGTGSNSVFFNGVDAREEVPALGFVLGDEGSGSYLGKRLLSDFLYKKMPLSLSNAFLEKYGVDKNSILDNTLKKPNVNVYLASFAPFLSENIGSNYAQKIVVDAFSAFVDIHVMCYKEAKDVPIHFVGSVAYYFKDQLKEVLEMNGLTLGNVLRKPIDGLVQFHN
ncbi:MAG: N-acetylglucosamine kinase [Flavobacteriales bacterium]|nr:N-acetylglucosamine kinase [Flavobacteriales bacterium]